VSWTKWILAAGTLIGAAPGWGQSGPTPVADCMTIDYGHFGTYPLFWNTFNNLLYQEYPGEGTMAYVQYGYVSYTHTSGVQDNIANGTPPTSFSVGAFHHVSGASTPVSNPFNWDLNGALAFPDSGLPGCPAMHGSGQPVEPHFKFGRF